LKIKINAIDFKAGRPAIKLGILISKFETNWTPMRLLSSKTLSAPAFLLAVLLCSCDSLQPDNRPPPVGEIVTPKINLSVFDRKSAVNFMVTSIATQCAPISTAGINLPYIVNDFTASDGLVNNMPLELWQSLIKMKMIVPVDDNDAKKQYRLLSEIKETGNSPEKKDYSWELRLVSIKDNTEIWKDSVEFVVISTPQPKD